MDPLSNTLGLEEERSFSPQQTLYQSTDINSKNPWTFQMSSDVAEDDIPRVTVEFNSKVEVHGFKLQGSGEGVKNLEFILLAKSEDTGQFVEVLQDQKLGAILYGENQESIVLESSLPGVVAVRLEVRFFANDNAGSGSLRLDVLGCVKGE